jgi:uncharacterized protein
MGVLTLAMVAVSWGVDRIFGDKLPPAQFFHIDELFTVWTLIGIEFGLLCGAVMLLATSTETAKESFQFQTQFIRSMRLSFFDCLLLSLCAGIGEEYLFRITLQEWLHPLIVAVVFVAIHGYLNPFDWNTTKYGLLILGFIIALSYAVDVQGLWFCIGAHAAYDFVLFYHWSRQR